jgi:Na+/H+-dicarboxylate symporter
MAIASRRPGLGTLVLTGFALGIFCGLFFGEMAAALNPIGRAYIRLLQMAIVPYITVSLIACPGRIANHYLKTVIWTVLFLNATFLPCSALP